MTVIKISSKRRRHKLVLHNYLKPFHLAQIERLQSISMRTIKKESKASHRIMDQIMRWKAEHDSELRSSECCDNYSPLCCGAFLGAANEGMDLTLTEPEVSASMIRGGFALWLVNQRIITTVNLFLFSSNKKISPSSREHVVYCPPIFPFLACRRCVSYAAVMREPW